jgi:uncharacterized flavoprotein (TIGR03862 family)
VKTAVVGGGPAGLRAAEIAIAGGAEVTLFDAKPSVGRKFLVAGRGGLNLTKAEPAALFATRYTGPEQPPDFWSRTIGDFDFDALRAWAAGLGIETFVASTGRVYPREMKAAPLLRRWVERLRQAGVTFAPRHRWTGFAHSSGAALSFQSEHGTTSFEADAAILALGGGSWPDTGSDGHWTSILSADGICVAPLAPANCGWECGWPESVLEVAEGAPLKSIAVSAGGQRVLGELLITRYGLEGGAIYQLGHVLRAQTEPAIEIDFKPTVPIEKLLAKLGPIRRNLLPEAEQRWKLPPPAVALLQTLPTFSTPEELARAVKAFPLALDRPRPLVEAISSAGGVSWSEVDESLMLHRRPGVFVAGEMLDWEAPTGGYLIHGSFTTGALAARGALSWLASR